VENIVKETIMADKRVVAVTGAVAELGVAWPAFAAGSVEDGGIGFWIILFLAFGALIIAFQFIPAIALFASMVRGVFRRAETQTDNGRRVEKNL
jgi:hypothetical protein